MTKDGSNARKRAARELAEAEQIPYTEALRRVDQRTARALGAGDDGDEAARGTAVSSVRVMEPVATITPDAVLVGHTNQVGSVVFHPDGRSLVSGGDTTVRIWDLASGQTVTGLTLETSVWSIALSPDGGTVAVGDDDGTVALWTIATGQISALTGCVGAVDRLGFSPDGRTLVAGSQDPSRGRRRPPDFSPAGSVVRQWNLDTGKNAAWTVPVGQARAFHPDGHTLVVGGDDATARLWSLAGELSGELTGHTNMIETAAVSPDGRLLATGAADCMVRIWDLASGQTTALLNPRGGYVTSVAFSPDSRTLASGTRGGVTRLWDAASGRPTATLLGHTELISAQAFSPDGRTLATGSSDMTIRLWTVA